MADTRTFSQWVFDSLVENGAIRDYAKTPPGKGKPPSGNMSIQSAKIAELRKSPDPNLVLWGLVGQALVADGVSRRLVSEYGDYAAKYYPEDPNKLVSVMRKAAMGACEDFKVKYVKNKPEPAATVATFDD